MCEDTQSSGAQWHIERATVPSGFEVCDVRCVLGQSFAPPHVRCCSFSDAMLTAVRQNDCVQLHSLVSQLQATGHTAHTTRVVQGDSMHVLRAEKAPSTDGSNNATLSVTLAISMSVTIERSGDSAEPIAAVPIVPPFLIAEVELNGTSSSSSGGLCEEFAQPHPHIFFVPLTSWGEDGRQTANYQLDGTVSSNHQSFTFPGTWGSRNLHVSVSVYFLSELLARSVLLRLREVQHRLEKSALEQKYFGLACASEMDLPNQVLPIDCVLHHVRAAFANFPSTASAGNLLFRAVRQVYISCCMRPGLITTRNVIPLEEEERCASAGPFDRNAAVTDQSKISLLAARVSKSVVLSKLLDELACLRYTTQRKS